MRSKLILPLMLAVALAGCTTPQGADVVRFHTSQPIGRGTIAIVPADKERAGSLEFETYARSIGQELARLGFTPVQSATGANMTALVDVAQGSRAGVPRQSGLSVGLGGLFGSGNVGLGTSVQVPVGQKSSSNEIQSITLSVQLRDSGGRPLWEGRATTEASAGKATATPAGAVPALARALFSDFPGQSGRTVRVQL